MNFFTIRMSLDTDGCLTKLLKEGVKKITITQLNQHFEKIDSNSCFLLCIGGGKTANDWWAAPEYKGLLFIASLEGAPKKYDEKNYRIDVNIEYKFSRPLTKRDYVYYPDSYDTVAAPATKGSQTQAISFIEDEKQYLALLRGAMFYDRNAEIFYERYFGIDFLNKIKAPIKRLTENYFDYETELSNDKRLYISTSPTSALSPVHPIQRIYYGVPGSGKSHKIDSEIEGKIPSKADRDFQTVRVVFHPDYTNADFVGQILPVTTPGGIKYEFKPGAFSKILWRAYHNPEKTFYLVVEEINRGNAAAIFGDIFQLLDRRSDGWSKYFVENDFVNNYLRSPVEFSDSTFSENHGNPAFQINGSAFTANSGIRLPPNLSILATMNTSDQNVFTLDNAFQRRWSMELVPNVLEKDSDQYNLQIGETGICWGRFRKTANEFISKDENNATFSSMEDSRLGSYFIQAEENNSISIKSFAEKVLKYLWDDVFKMNHEQFFRITDSFESVVNEFLESKSFDSILNEEIAAELKNESTAQ